MCKELTVEEWETNFDEVFEAVSKGETFIIRDEKGRAFYLMPYDEFDETNNAK
jgi:hypothetical protein